MTKTADDPRFHRTLMGSLSDYDEAKPPAVYYVENGNFVAGYDQLALDYKMAADALLQAQEESGLGNWLAPVVFMVRQTLELSLKALLEATVDRGNVFSAKLTFSHSVDLIWENARDWLIAKGYKIKDDARFELAEWLIVNFSSVDPTGDLFRFSHSKHDAFGRKKTYDRAGINDAVFRTYFDQTYGFLSHWQGVLVMEWIEAEALKEGRPYTRPRDPDDFPRK